MIDFSSIWFPFIIFEAYYQFKLKENKFLPHSLYPFFRENFGRKLKQISCVFRSVKNCAECKLNLSCPYGYLFETVTPSDADRLKKYPYLPHPLSFFIPFISPPASSENIVKIGVLLVGKGMDFFPYVIFAIKSISENFYPKKFEFFKFLKIKDTSTGKDLTTSEKICIPDPVDYKNFLPFKNAKQLKLQTISPIELRFQGKTVFPEKFSFSVLVRNILRRISALAYFHCQKEIILDFKKIIEISQMVKTQTSFKVIKIKIKSQRTKKFFPLCGLAGEAIFKDPLKNLISEFYPLILLGSFVQVGKHTSFGFGKYEILSEF